MKRRVRFSDYFVRLAALGSLATAYPASALTDAEPLIRQYFQELGGMRPEIGSSHGMSEFDAQTTDWSAITPEAELQFLRRWINKLNSIPTPASSEVAVDLQLFQRRLQIEYSGTQTRMETLIPFVKAAEEIYASLETLMNPQASKERHHAVGPRFHEIVSKRTLNVWRERIRQSRENKALLLPYRAEVEDYLHTSPSLLEAIKDFLVQAGAFDAQEFESFRQQLNEYDQFIASEILPRARSDFKLPRPVYVQYLAEQGVTFTPEDLMTKAKADYDRLLPEFREVTRRLGSQLNLPEAQLNPRGVSDALRALPVKGAVAIVDFTKALAQEVAQVIESQNLMTLPAELVPIRMATPVESALSPFPFVNLAPALGVFDQKPEYVIAVDEAGNAFDIDSVYRAAAVTLTAHEVFGHGLQFSLLRNPGKLARAVFGTGNVPTEGWAMYMEHLMLPYHDLPARYGALQSILFRVARAYLDPMLNLGMADSTLVNRILVDELGMTDRFAQTEYERYTWRMPGQASSYYVGMTSLIEMKERVRKSQGQNFSERAFNDHVLRAGPMPFDLCESLLLNAGQ